MLNPGTILQNRYQIIRQLGEGGMGAVYLALQFALNKYVALKESFATDAASVDQFQSEAAILARLSHPNLPRVTDFFVEANGARYLAMDFVDGQNLEQIVQQRGALAEGDVRAWMAQILNAVKYLHVNGIVHRDINPRNIIIMPDGRAMLVDFGLAKVYVAGQKTVVGASGMGTPGYAPPEQYSGGTDARSDVYALGATMYFLLSGATPLEAPLRASGAMLAPVRALNARVTSATERVIAHAMEVRTGARFASIAEIESAWTFQPEPSRAPVRAAVIGCVAVLTIIAMVIGVLLVQSGTLNWLASVAMGTRTPTATPPPDAVVQYTIDFRAGPGFFYDTQGTLTQGQTLQVLARYASTLSGVSTEWLQVLASGTPGWVQASQVTLNVPLSKLPTPSAIPPTPTPRLVTPSPSPTPTSAWLVADDFVDNHNVWQLYGLQVYLEGNSLHLKQSDEGRSLWATCRECGPFTDFVYEAVMTKLEGPDSYGYGVVFRGTRTGSPFYAFTVTGNGYWNFQKLEASGWSTLYPYTQHSAIARGNSRNKLKVSARGALFDFYVNDQLVGSATDSAFTSGYVGVGIATTGMHIRVESVRAWRVDSAPPSPTRTASTLTPTRLIVPTAAPTVPPTVAGIPAGMGCLIVVNYYGQESTFTISGKLYRTPGNGSTTIYLAPGRYTWSSDIPGVGRAGGDVTIVQGQCFTQSFAARP